MFSRRKSLALAASLAIAVALLSVGPAAGQIVLDGIISYGNNGDTVNNQYSTTCYADNGAWPVCPDCPPGQINTRCILQDVFLNNTETNPLLNPSYNNFAAPRWTPQTNSPALGTHPDSRIVQASLVDAYFQDTCYAGALDNVANWPADDWTQEWTYFNTSGGLGRTDIPAVAPDLVLGDINADTIWLTGHIYELNGRIAVNAGVTLTIQAGTVVTGAGVGSYLVVERDGNLVVQGTRAQPVVFTSSGDYSIGDQLPGDWGGVVIHGNAVANCAAATGGCGLTSVSGDCASEGGAGFFGGSDDSDDSGSIRYARVEYAGQEISPNNELNAWTFNAVGNGTELEYLQAVYGTDDCFEWFGGDTRSKHFVGVFGADDGFDWQMGFRGKHQFGVIMQGGGADGDNGIEADNNEFNFDCPLRSNPSFANMTFIGATLGGHGIHMRRGTNGTVINSIVVDFPDVAVFLEHAESYANGPGPQPTRIDPGSCPVTAAPELTDARFHLSVSPNPVIANSVFSFNLPAGATVDLRIYNAQGRLVDVVHQGEMGPGAHTLAWNPRRKAAGVYYYAMRAGANAAKGKLLVVN